MQIITIIDGHKCTCTPSNINIENSYQVPEVKMRWFLNMLLHEIDGRIIYKRTMEDWIKEWKAHNRLYKMGLYRSHTKDVDLNEDESKGRLLGYNILGL